MEASNNTIVKLPDSVISRISAGEVITSPYNIIKELIENSLDANSSKIYVKVDPSLNYILIKDDGIGIEERDMEFLCKNHYTSKIRELKDLKDTRNYGFRGEALYSISLCSRIKVITKKKREDTTGIEGIYEEGELKQKKEIALEETGTIIEIKDIFYNNQIRQEYFYKNKKEYTRCIELIRSYAILYPGIKLKDDPTLEIFLKNDDLESSIQYKMKFISENFLKNIDSVVKLFKGDGEKLFKENGEKLFKENGKKLFKEDGEKLFKEKGNSNSFLVICTDLNTSLKYFQFILFINGRLVKNDTLKNRIIKKYRNIKKGLNPFVFIEINVEYVDVNVHPSKEEVIIDEGVFERVIEIFEERSFQNYRVSENGIIYKGEDSNITTYKGEDSNITTYKGEDSNITTYKGEDSNITTYKGNDSTIVNEGNGHITVNEGNEHITINEGDSSIIFNEISPLIVNSPFNNNNKMNSPSAIKLYSSPFTRQLDESMMPSPSLRKKAVFDRPIFDEIDSSFFKSLIFVGCSDNFLFLQHQSNLLKINKEKFLYNIFYQKIWNDLGNFESSDENDCFLVNLNISSERMEFYREFLGFHFEFKDGKLFVTGLPKIYDLLPDFEIIEKCIDEFMQMHEIIENMARIFSKVECDMKLFNRMKMEMIGTEEMVRDMRLLVDLKDLYKTFDRC